MKDKFDVMIETAMAEYRRVRDSGGSEAEACAAADAVVGYNGDE